MPPRPQRAETIRFLTLDELGRLLAATRGSVRDRAMFLLAYRHGLRASEVGLLRGDDLDLRALRLAVHRLKGSLSGTHPLQPDEAKALRAWLRKREQPPSPVLFPSNRGDPIARRTLDWLMKKYGEAAELPPSKRHPPARRRRRPALRPGLARARQHPEHRDLRVPDHARARGRGAACLPQPAPLLTDRRLPGMSATTLDGTGTSRRRTGC